MSGFLSDSAGPYVTSSPSDNRDYSFDWSLVLQSGENISTSTWAATAGVTVGATTFTGSVTTAWVSGGSSGTTYTVTNTMTTSQGRTLARAFRLIVQTGI
jgi:hypothetical protein